MKQLFFDAAYIGKLHWHERGLPEVQALAAAPGQTVCWSPITSVDPCRCCTPENSEQRVLFPKSCHPHVLGSL